MEAAAWVAGSWGVSGSGGQEREMKIFTLMNGASAKTHHHLALNQAPTHPFLTHIHTFQGSGVSPMGLIILIPESPYLKCCGSFVLPSPLKDAF